MGRQTEPRKPVILKGSQVLSRWKKQKNVIRGNVTNPISCAGEGLASLADQKKVEETEKKKKLVKTHEKMGETGRHFVRQPLLISLLSAASGVFPLMT